MSRVPTRRGGGTPGPAPDDDLLGLMHALAAGDPRVLRAVRARPVLARAALASGATRASPAAWFLTPIAHYVYAGDTLLHVAAAAHDLDAVHALVEAGAAVRARNRRGAEPLHYAADGGPDLPTWAPDRQAGVVAVLVAAGADPDALDRDGVAALHRAARTRCTGAVRALLAAGADRTLPNGRGSTPLSLASLTTGRGGSGSPAAKREQAEILRLLTEPPPPR